ncbi:MAG: flagellar biosynthetic protein FliO [Selenomonadaceae bacterium]|nr:flagellar biosynthetic protein FliO [Selenomonadaceae bacterium]MBR1858322.1 flagellar biosynthetic protein FliO [Selenomonadaceae bacterium]
MIGNRKIYLFFAFILVVITFLNAGQVTAEAAGGYLAGYEDVEPKPAGVSWWSTIAYILSLLAVFAVVFFMAYFAAKFLGGRFNARIPGHGGRVLENLPLGANRSVCIIEMADRVFLLGVTDQSITLLTEVLDPEEIERLRNQANFFSSDMFSQEFGSLSSLVQKLSSLKKRH